MIHTHAISYRLANKGDKKSIQRFYKSQHYSASFIGNDLTLLALKNQTIVGSVIISLVTNHEKNTNHWFLHALVVLKELQGNGIAKQLIKNAVLESKKQANNCNNKLAKLTCFADKSLASFYLSNNFKAASPLELPDELSQRLNRYLNKQPHLQVFVFKRQNND